MERFKDRSEYERWKAEQLSKAPATSIGPHDASDGVRRSPSPLKLVLAALGIVVIGAGLWFRQGTSPEEGRSAKGVPSRPERPHLSEELEARCGEDASAFATMMKEANKAHWPAKNAQNAYEAAREAQFYLCLQELEERGIKAGQVWATRQRAEELKRLAHARLEDFGSLLQPDSPENADADCRRIYGVDTSMFYDCRAMFEREGISTGQPWASQAQFDRFKALAEQKAADVSAPHSRAQAETQCHEFARVTNYKGDGQPGNSDGPHFDRCMTQMEALAVTAGRPWTP
jgi:hypothetical protein